jgi:hypothetical protein
MFEVWWLYRKRRKIVAKADREAAAALQSNNSERAKMIAAESYLACLRIDQRLGRFQDQSIRQEAQELDIAFPPFEEAEMWHAGDDQNLRLSFRGRAYLRKLIDEEESRRFEVKTLWVTKFWLPLLAGLVGIIGAATGFIAVWRHGK